MQELEAELIAKLDAEKAAQAAAEAVPGYSAPPPRWTMRRPLPMPGPNLTTYQQRRLSTKQLAAEREDKARRGAGLLALAAELKERREAQVKAAAERRTAGVKLSYAAWHAEIMGE